ncbi:hypothetical protein [Lysobacter korlensis]|uniref:hypothetical protein n=1 Tax=Lysobacter korlensis TaxID=553636 RepID=UPI0036D949AE
MPEFWRYLSLTLPVALVVWALVEWWQRRKRVPKSRIEPTLDEPKHEREAECPHPRFKRVYVLRNGTSAPTDEMQCVKCRQRMKG